MVTLWPDGVSSKPDMRFFCQMMVGDERMNHAFDYDVRMPFPRQEVHQEGNKGQSNGGRANVYHVARSSTTEN